MTQEERVVELLNESEILCDTCGECSSSYCAEALAKYLLANKVTAHPVALGDEVYMVVTCGTTRFQFGSGRMQKIKNQHFFVKKSTVTKNNYFDVIEKFGETVFLTKKEADAKKKEMEGKL